MSLFRLIVLGIPLLNIAWWLWAEVRLRSVPGGRWWRLGIGAFTIANVAGYVWLIGTRFAGFQMPAFAVMECYIWNLVILPALLCLITLIEIGHVLARRWTSKSSKANARANAPATTSTATTPALTTRRQILIAGAAAFAPAATALGQVRAVQQLRGFRIRRLKIDLPGLPPALDGLTIAHVTDLHVGQFTHGQVLQDAVAQTHQLKADLTVFTGDLIDFSLNDLGAGIDILKQLAPAGPFAMCEGNHDLFQNGLAFRSRVAEAGLPLLLNNSRTFEIRGVRVQLLGICWGGAAHGPMIDEHMDATLPHLDPDAFPILLAHHPHAFDRAAAAGIPLTLAGHTHGGQLQLTHDIGVGPLLFKYWSGVYRRGDAALVVSNGVGNWFPLRINAPAEILQITVSRSKRSLDARA